MNTDGSGPVLPAPATALWNTLVGPPNQVITERHRLSAIDGQDQLAQGTDILYVKPVCSSAAYLTVMSRQRHSRSANSCYQAVQIRLTVRHQVGAALLTEHSRPDLIVHILDVTLV